MSTPASLMCLDKTPHMVLGVLLISGPWDSRGWAVLGSPAFLSLCGFCLPPLQLFCVDSCQLLV